MSGPYITIRIDANAGEASANFTEQFYSETDIWRLDVLQDVIYDLTEKYNETFAEAFPDDDPKRH